MDKFVNIVDFEVRPGKADEVVKLVSENACTSLSGPEPGSASVRCCARRGQSHPADAL